MLYDLKHVTTYKYQGLVDLARCVLHHVPVDRPGQQVLSATLELIPRPRENTAGRDFFGNRIDRLEFEGWHRGLAIDARARVRVDPPRLPGATPAWEAVASAAGMGTALGPDAPAHFLFASRDIPLIAAARDYAAASAWPGRGIFDTAMDLTRRIHADFAYDTKASTVSTPVSATFAARRGVCQDFAHAMIGGLRALGLPAAYVSGYLRTVPPPGRVRLAGADATHAWVSVWCGADAGWIGFDPTNAIVAGEDHIILAIGRDYADVPPLEGVVTANGRQKLKVGVDVVPVAG